MPNPSFSQQDFQEQLNQPDNHAFIQSLKQYSTADLADILMGLPINDQIRLLEQLPQASYVFEFLALTEQQQLAAQLPQALLVKLLAHMHSDDRTDLFSKLSAGRSRSYFSAVRYACSSSAEDLDGLSC